MASLSASEIQSQLTSLKEAARARSPGELGRVDQVGILSCYDCYSVPILSRVSFDNENFSGVSRVHGPQDPSSRRDLGCCCWIWHSFCWDSNWRVRRTRENQHSIVFGSRYYNIDALDADLPTLQRLQALRLYRNYICRRVKHVREGVNGKKTFSYGHRPNDGGGVYPCPNFLALFFRSAFLVNKKSLFLQKCQCIELLTVF